MLMGVGALDEVRIGPQGTPRLSYSSRMVAGLRLVYLAIIQGKLVVGLLVCVGDGYFTQSANVSWLAGFVSHGVVVVIILSCFLQLFAILYSH